MQKKIIKKDFQRLLFILLTLFYLIPTFLYFDINGDKGKGLANMIIIYLLGRYLKLYPPKTSTKKLWIALLCSMAVAFAGNCFVTAITHNIHWPFGRDCTATTLVSYVSAFMIAQRCNFSSKPINFVAKNSFYIYLLDFPRVIIQDYFDISRFENEIYYLPICLGIVILSMAISFTASLVLKYPALLIEKILAFMEKSAGKALEKILPCKKNELSDFLKGDNLNV